jgi:tryptophan-rich sensory protein
MKHKWLWIVLIVLAAAVGWRIYSKQGKKKILLKRPEWQRFCRGGSRNG